MPRLQVLGCLFKVLEFNSSILEARGWLGSKSSACMFKVLELNLPTLEAGINLTTLKVFDCMFKVLELNSSKLEPRGWLGCGPLVCSKYLS